jgi:hypothetical protein
VAGNCPNASEASCTNGKNADEIDDLRIRIRLPSIAFAPSSIKQEPRLGRMQKSGNAGNYREYPGNITSASPENYSSRTGEFES